MNKGVNLYYGFFITLFCMLNLRCGRAKDPNGANVNYKGKFTSDITNYEIVVPQRVNKDGFFISHVVSHQHSKRSAKEMDQIFYKIPIAGKEYLIELMPNRKLISPSAVVETRNVGVGNLSEGYFAKSTNEKLEEMIQNLNVRKLKNTECHFSGYVKGENISKAALSTCCGLAGFIQIETGFYTIEPVAEHDPFIEDAFPHILYKSNGLENSTICHTVGALREKLADQVSRKRREIGVNPATPMYIETLVVMDPSLINYHSESDCENYVLTVFNMASNLFHDASLGLILTLTIVRIIRLEVETVGINLKLNTNALKTLENFQNWQYAINPGDDSHPNHHDVAVLLTRVDVCYSPSSCGLLGLSTVGKACDPKLSAVLCEDNGLRLGFVIAHEISHLLGADHDGGNSTCNGTDSEGLKTVMHPQVSLNSQTWSKCSGAHIRAFFKSGMGNCFLDEPEDHHFNVQDLLPGVMYNADFQCKHFITLDSRECDVGSTCDSLNCYVPGYACIITHTPPADGTRCGENMWCHDNKCIMVGQRPGAVDGNWGEWSPWSECTRTCGSGVSSSVRQCDKPLPSHGGKNCFGERKRYKICASTPCKTGRPSFRDIQCGEFDDWVYPEDGKTHTWKAYYLHEDNPCMLYCVNEKNEVAALKARVVDGTMCFRGIRDICIGGICRTLPCDLHFESNAIEDACGVCHGDGTGCEFSGGTETFTSSKELTKLINVPSGTRNIKVEELTDTLAKIIVKDKETKEVYVQGKSLGMYTVPGSQAWLGMIKKNQEVLNIPGPINKPLSIWIQRDENVTVKWSMALPPSQQRKPEFAWDFLKWGPCSAKCGPGIQKSEPNCMEEKSGLVESSYCTDLEMPQAKVRPCQIAKCEPRWMVGDWKGCENPNNGTKVRKRVVYCIKTVGEGEGESEIVLDSECPKPKPHDVEPCEKRQKREDSDYNNSEKENSRFRSDTVEFGFHKKYDDYLTHFGALSGPQRKSETIPLHLLSSPHFKHYFRVLETPEDDSTEIGSDGNFDVNFSNAGIVDRRNRNKVSPDFYKSTFSGNGNDISHVHSQSDYGLKSQKNGPMKRRNIRERKRIKNRKKKKKRRWNSENFVKQSKKNGRAISGETTDQKSSKRSPIKPERRHIRREKSKRSKSRRKSAKRCERKSSRKNARHSLMNLFSKKQDKNFNYTSPNLRDVIDRLACLDSQARSRYLNLIANGYGNGLSIDQKVKENSCGISESGTGNIAIGRNNTSKMNSGHMQLQPKNEISRNEMLSPNNEAINNKLNKEFDGSGIKIFNRENLVAGKDKYKWQNKELDEKEIHFLNPINLATDRNNFRSTKKRFRSGDRNAIAEVNKKKLQSKMLRKRNVHFLVMREGLNDITIYDCRMKPKEESSKKFRRSKITKRLSRKWKKQKAKDSNVKGGKEFSGSGCGSETRNYLNNLFRDSHAKVNPKQEQKEENEEMVIDTGRSVIDNDLAENQQIEVLLQEDYDDESNRKYKSLPRPNQNNKKLLLKGQDVFDLYQKLRQGNDQRASYEPKNNVENGSPDKDEEKIEIDVKIPNDPQRQSSAEKDDLQPEKEETLPQKEAEDQGQDQQRPAKSERTTANTTTAATTKAPAKAGNATVDKSNKTKSNPTTKKTSDATSTTTQSTTESETTSQSTVKGTVGADETTTTAETTAADSSTEDSKEDSSNSCNDYDVDTVMARKSVVQSKSNGVIATTAKFDEKNKKKKVKKIKSDSEKVKNEVKAKSRTNSAENSRGGKNFRKFERKFYF